MFTVELNFVLGVAVYILQAQVQCCLVSDHLRINSQYLSMEGNESICFRYRYLDARRERAMLPGY